MLVITLNENYVIHYPIAGEFEYDEILAKYIDNILTWTHGKGTVETSLDRVLKITCPYECNVPFEVTHLGLVMSKQNGSVSGYMPVIAINEAVYSDEIPEGLPNRTYETVDDTDPENPITTEHVHTWKSWRKPNTSVLFHEGAYYYNSYAVNYKALPMSGVELMIIYNTENVTLVDKKPEVEQPEM